MITNLIITAYCACRLCCGTGAHGITASGVKVHPGQCASNDYAFGSRLRIGGQWYIVTDRLASRFHGRVDLFMKSHKKALRYGIRKMLVQVYAKK